MASRNSEAKSPKDAAAEEAAPVVEDAPAEKPEVLDEPEATPAEKPEPDPEADRAAALAAFAAGGTVETDPEPTVVPPAPQPVERTGLVHAWGGTTSYLVVKHSFFTTNEGGMSVTAYRGDVVKIPDENAAYGLEHGTIVKLDD